MPAWGLLRNEESEATNEGLHLPLELSHASVAILSCHDATVAQLVALATKSGCAAIFG